MDQLEHILNPYGFIRVEQGVIVNMEAAEKFYPDQMLLQLKSGDFLYVSRRNKAKVLAYFDNI